MADTGGGSLRRITLAATRTGRGADWRTHVRRIAYASAVLADGRLVCYGGEYSDASGVVSPDFTNTCEIYDPVANTWTTFDPPTRLGLDQPWKEIGDAVSTLLPDGTFLMGSLLDANVAKLDPTTLTWTAMSKHPDLGNSDEDGWVLMPDNTVVGPSCQLPPSTWIYQIATDEWVRGSDLLVNIIEKEDEEIGPGFCCMTDARSSSAAMDTTRFIRRMQTRNGRTRLICRHR
jgi:Kelch motif